MVIAYAQTVPEKILKAPKYGCINVHASLLPKYRGASCVQAPIMRGESQTGITIIKMNERLDAGPILTQQAININPDDTGGSLSDRLAELASELLIPTLKQWIVSKIKPQPQDEADATYIPKLKKQDGRIDWSRPAVEVEQFIRAMTPWPSAFAYAKTENRIMIKILRAEHQPIKVNKYNVGEIFIHGDKLAVQCGKDALVIQKLQLQGKKEITGKEFLCGYEKLVGSILG